MAGSLLLSSGAGFEATEPRGNDEIRSNNNGDDEGEDGTETIAG